MPRAQAIIEQLVTDSCEAHFTIRATGPDATRAKAALADQPGTRQIPINYTVLPGLSPHEIADVFYHGTPTTKDSGEGIEIVGVFVKCDSSGLVKELDVSKLGPVARKLADHVVATKYIGPHAHDMWNTTSAGRPMRNPPSYYTQFNAFRRAKAKKKATRRSA